MEFEHGKTPRGQRCSGCARIIHEPEALEIRICLAPGISADLTPVWLCWDCTEELPDRAAGARSALASRLEYLEDMAGA